MAYSIKLDEYQQNALKYAGHEENIKSLNQSSSHIVSTMRSTIIE